MSTALYRRYRPETFADVIGQEHVTDPLRAALRGDRITHAYLFSGPRGCGKTTSARIFARCLNCVEGPTDNPCGSCPSCVDLARGGAGSLDVVEMDAASHGGVDDARELRERAAFAPARDRYKVFIIDEAHMVTSQGFNALLKLVEEPPAHVKFVFATTEPEKVIGTIRSRTHHYPFRLVPPERLQGYLEELCTAEGVRVASGVLPLVVRAGGGSVRDSLSVLDQLIAGAEDGEVSYERAVALLGYTHAALLDDVVDALAARDGASLFRVVDRVIDSGHDPRRFAEDLLERIRDLVVIAAAGEHAVAVLRSLPQDQFERMRVQSQQIGPADLSRAGDLINEALTEMSGATSPRLQLELMCARLLLPGADDAARGYAARLDRIERYLSQGAAAPAVRPTGGPDAERPARDGQAEPRRPATQQQPAAPGADPDEPAADEGGTRSTGEAGEKLRSRRGDEGGDRSTGTAGEKLRSRREGEGGDQAAPEPPAPAAEPAPSAVPQPSPSAVPQPSPGADAELIRRRWSEVLATLAGFKRSTWALVSQNAQVAEVSGGVLHLAFATSGLAHTFRNGAHADPLQRALAETLGVQLRIEPVLSQGAESGSGAQTPYAASDAPSAAWGGAGAEPPGADVPAPAPGPRQSPQWPDTAPAGPQQEDPDGPAQQAGPAAGATPPGNGTPSAPSAGSAPSTAAGSARSPAPPPDDATADAPPAGAASPARISDATVARISLAEDTPSPDDPDAEHSDLSGAKLIEQLLGGTVIEERED